MECLSEISNNLLSESGVCEAGESKSDMKVTFCDKFQSEVKKIKKDATEANATKDRCRQINLMAQIHQSSWKLMVNLKELTDQIAEKDMLSKREEMYDNSNADFEAVFGVIDTKLVNERKEKAHENVEEFDSKQEGKQDLLTKPNAEGVKLCEKLNKQSASEVVEDHFTPSLQFQANQTKEKLFKLLDADRVEPGPFSTGSVGDSPIHGCFLLGLHELGFELIQKYYSDPTLLSMQYENDLDIWRNTPNSISVDDGQSSQYKQSHDQKQLHQKLADHQEDGLYTGETILHIAIVQEQEKVVNRLLENGIEISSRAKGIFFQPRLQYPRSTDLSYSEQLKAQMMGIDLVDQTFVAVKRIENTHSGCYYGEYPLSFAASVGNVDICDQLYRCWRRRVEAVLLSPASLQQSGDRDPCKMTAGERRWIERTARRPDPQDVTGPKSPSPTGFRHELFRDQSFVNRNHHKCFNEGGGASRDEDTAPLLARHPIAKGAFRDPGSMPRRRRHLMWEFLNAADSFGNTAMHMAVMYNQKHVIDWLMKLDEGKDSMALLNLEGFTPLTLAARLGKVEVFHHILYEHMSQTAWTYGKVSSLIVCNASRCPIDPCTRCWAVGQCPGLAAASMPSRVHAVTTLDCLDESPPLTVACLQVRMVRTELTQIDTYKIKEGPEDSSADRRANSSRGNKVGPVRQPESSERPQEGGPRAAEALPVKPAKSLQHNSHWRSALEVIVDHEVQEFVKDDLFQRLIHDKWRRFGRRMYIRRTVVPYLTVLACLIAVGYLRGTETNAAWPFVPDDGGSDDSVMCLRNANMSSPSAFVAWIKSELPPQGADVGSSVVNLFLNLLLVVLFAPFLAWKGWRQRNFRLLDLDTDADARISVAEAMLFVQKNLHLIFNILGALLIVCAAAARLACHDSAELNLLAIACIVLCFNLINVLLPFRFFGPIVIMMYKILREDVGRFLSIYGIVLTGFSCGLFLLFQRAKGQKGCELPGAGGCSAADEPYVYSGMWDSTLWLVWVSLGDSVGAVQVSFSQTQSSR